VKRCLACDEGFTSEDWFCPRCGVGPAHIDGLLAFAPELAEASDGYDAEHFARLFELEARHFWFRARNRLIQWAMATHFSQARSLLEVGCGTGYVLAGLRASFPELALSGGEIFTRGLGFAQRRMPGATLLQMDARAIPFEREFDVVGAFDVIEHIDEDDAVLAQMQRAVKPGGGLLLTVPQHAWLWSSTDDDAHHKRRYGSRELVSKVERAGFRVVKITSFVSLLLPAMALARLAPRARQARTSQHDPYAELRMGQPANALFETTMTLERALIRAGLSLPTGGSLLLVAVRG
jgi:SAM-dependent methyltransferase